MRLHTPRALQGGIVERSYGWNDGVLYRKTLDRAAQVVQWHRADEASASALMDDGEAEGFRPESAERAPYVEEWIACEEPSDEGRP